MNIASEGYPSVFRLWRGANLYTIAHGVYHASDPVGCDISWVDNVYVRTDGSGTRGAVAFSAAGIVGTFCDSKSPRAPFRQSTSYSLEEYLSQAPERLRPLAYLASQYFTYSYGGKIAPAVTCIFWSDGELLTAAEPWSEVVEHGAHVLEIETMDSDDAALEAVQKDLDLNSAQMTLVSTLFLRRMASPNAPVALQTWEYEVLVAEGDAGIEESRTLLAAVGVVVP